MKKRLFVAVPLAHEYITGLEQYRRVRQAEAFLAPQKIRWTASENLHLTICFIGHVEEVLLEGIVQVLREVSGRHEPFTLDFQGVWWGPPIGPARMVWAVFKKHISFARLSKDVTKTLSQHLAYMVQRNVHILEERVIIPHGTLARFDRLEKRRLPELAQVEHAPARMPVRSFVLYESKLEREGATYTELSIFSLWRNQ